MKTKKQTAGKTAGESVPATETRVVLNLSMEQAKNLKGFIYLDGISNPHVEQENKAFLQKIYNRLEKTINKHENSGPLTKEEVIEGFGELPDDVMEAVTQASQDAIDQEKSIEETILEDPDAMKQMEEENGIN